VTDTRVAGRYEPLEVVGRGGEATVLKAVDTRHERLVALKVRLVPRNGSSDDLLTEARALLSLPPHPGLAHARDDLFDDGRHVLVLDWVEGVNLARLLADEGRPGLPVSSVLRWIAQAAEALTALHQHGVVHGDVKPANLILDRDGRIVVVDLGSSSVPMTEAARGGTPGFRAPEIAAGGRADRSSDVFSLAATAFALLTGAPPTGGRPAWNGMPAEVAERLEAALRSGLSIDPARRPATPGELVERLRAGWDDQTPTGVATALLTDVVDSSTLWERTPQRVPALLAEMQLVVDRSVEEHGGRRIGATVEGDTTVSVFPNVSNAVRAAVALQAELGRRPGSLQVRAGLATGEVVDLAGEIFGPTLNRAARVRDLARAGEVLLSASTADLVRPAFPPGVDLLALGPHVLRGLDGVDEIAAVVSDGVTTPPDPTRSPYPGLASFAPEDADLFFGREEVVERCLELFVSERFVAVVGASGSGKTSLALAGLAPRLNDIVVLRPGVHPLRSLEASADRDTAVLIVDQLEELVTLCHDPSEQAAFVNEIVAHPGGLIVTARADLYGEFGAFDQLAGRLASSQVLLGPLGDQDLRRAVQAPARRCGLAVEEGLADVIAADLEDAPGALPLLGHALREAWLRREGRTITLAGYRDSGGVRSAIAATAERALAALDEEGQAVARRILLRMVELRPEGDDARRWVLHREISEIDPTRAADVVATLAAARLLVVDRDQTTVVHEALLRAWPRLNGWIAEERADLLARQEVRTAAERWDEDGRTDGDLYRGSRLDAALDLTARAPLPSQHAEFVEAGRRLRDREQSDAKRRARRLRVLAAVTSALAVIALVVGAIAVLQRNDARDARIAADEAATIADARRAGAEGMEERAYDRALLLAAEGQHLWDSAETRGNLLNTIERNPQALGVIRNGQPRLVGVDSAPASRQAMVFDSRDEITLYDMSTRQAVASLAEAGMSYPVADFSPDGDVVAVSSLPTECLGSAECADAAVEVFDARDLSPRGVRYDGFGYFAADVAYSPDGSSLAAIGPLPWAGPLDNIAVWRVDAPGEPASRLSLRNEGELQFLTPYDFPSGWVRFSPDGTRLYASGAGPTIAFDLANGGEVRRFEGLGALALSPDGRTIAIKVTQDRIGLFDTASGARRAQLAGHDAAITAAAFSADGTMVASVSNDETVIVWDVSTGERRQQFHGHAGSVLGVDFSADGSELYTSGADGSVIIWDLDRTRGLTRDVLGPSVPDAHDLSVSPTGDAVLLVAARPRSSGIDGSALHLLDVRTGALTELLTGGFQSTWAVFAPDGKQLATVGTRGEVRLYEVPTGALLATDRGRGVENLGALAYSADGRHLVVADVDGVVTELDARTLEPSGRTLELGTESRGIRATVDGVVAVTSSAEDVRTDTEVVFADLDDGRILHRVQIPGWGVRANFSPDGRRYAYGTLDGTVGVIDVASGERVGSSAPVHQGPTTWVAFSPDGATLASIGFDGQMVLADAATATPRAGAQPGPPNLLGMMVYAEDGHTVVVAYHDGSVRTFDTDPAAWDDHACAVAGRNLTEQEWRDAFGDRPYRETCPES
jgi:WD40 repeat protein/class 3 adenylate cyclase